MKETTLRRSVQLHAKLSLFGIALIWGLGFVVVKEALRTVDPMSFVAWRFLSASVILMLIFNKHIKKGFKNNEILAGCIAGSCLIAGFCFQTIGMLYTSAGKAGFLTGLNILMVPFLAAFFLKHRLLPKELIGSMFATVGLGFLCLDKNLQFATGDLWVVASALGFALQIIAIARFAKKYDPIRFAIIQLFWGAIVSFILASIFENPFQAIPLISVGWIVFMGLFSTAIVFVLQMWAQNHTTPTQAALLLGLESPLAAVFGWALLREQMGSKELLGCALIFLGMLIVTLRRGRVRTQT